MEQVDPTPERRPANFTSRLVQVTAVILFAAVAWKLAGVLILAFSAILFAVVLSMVANGLGRLLRCPRRLALALAIVLLVGTLGGVTALFGIRITGQFEQIFDKAVDGANYLEGYLQAHGWGVYLLRQARGVQFRDATGALGPVLGWVLSRAGRFLGYTAIIVASGIFLALDPDRYIRGFVLLVPTPQRPMASDFLARSGAILRKWLISRLVVMAAVGVLASIGLRLLGIEAAFTLGLTGAILTFIPFIGALVAAAPAVLVALADSPMLALYTGLMFWAVHFIEGTFITPIVQDEQVYLPPVLTIFSTLAFTVLFGAAGVFLASPIMLVVIVAIRIFYMEAVLHEPPAPAGTVKRPMRVWCWPVVRSSAP